MSGQVELSGPLFAPGASQRFTAEAEAVVRELTETGMEHLVKDLNSSYKRSRTGNNTRNVHPTISGPMARITQNNTTYGAWIEGTSQRNETTRFKGYANFRRELQHLNEIASDVCTKHAEKLAKDLGG